MLYAIGLAVGIWVGSGVAAANPPTDAEVLRAMPQLTRGIPLVFEMFRDDIVIVKNCLKSSPAEVTVFGLRLPLVNAHWECSVYYTETLQSDFPFPVKVRKPRVQVVYLDRTTVVK
jgi:hypothetical protein